MGRRANSALAFKAICGIDRFRCTILIPPPARGAQRTLPAMASKSASAAARKRRLKGADVITTCTADKQNATILTDNMVGAGVHINAVGGDCPGKTELHKDILLRSEIFVEYPPQTRIEGEIQQLAPDHPVTELWRVISAGNCRAAHRRGPSACSTASASRSRTSRRYAICGAGAAHRLRAAARHAGGPGRSTRPIRHVAARGSLTELVLEQNRPGRARRFLLQRNQA